jgi:glucose/arabinose dehydrogenase
MPLRLSAILAAAALAVAAPPASAALHLTPVGTGFDHPVYVTAPPGDPHRLFVVEQPGRIVELVDGVQQATPFLDIHSEVKSTGTEQGLLSMAFAPDYAVSGRYYVYYTAPRAGDSGGSVITVEEFSPSGRRVVFTVDHPTNSNHNGGQLQFGPDGMLYAGTGDGGSGNDPPGNAQNPSSRLGKLLRTNPLSTSGTPEIYALGLRNPFRFSFDRGTGDLTIGDVGQNAYEEVDFAPAGTAAGRNYGWNCREGMHATAGVTCTAPGAVDPVLEKEHSSTGFCAIIGGYVVRDTSVPELTGRYVYGDNCASGIRSVTLPGAHDDAATGLTVSGLSSFGEDSCGHVYAASLGGSVYRIDGDAFTPCPLGGGPVPTPPDTRPPVVRIGAHRRQRVLRLRGVRLSVNCDEMCGATATGVVRITGRRGLVLARVARQLGAHKRVKVTLKASRKTLRSIRAALRRHRRVTVKITVVGRDAAGNAGRATRTVRATL